MLTLRKTKYNVVSLNKFIKPTKGKETMAKVNVPTPKATPKVAPKVAAPAPVASAPAADNPKYKIEANVPMPTVQRVAQKEYPFEALGEGDSFFVSVERTGDTDEERNVSFKDGIKRVKNRLGSATRSFSKKNPEYKFAIRGVTGGVRIWRVSVGG